MCKQTHIASTLIKETLHETLTRYGVTARVTQSLSSLSIYQNKIVAHWISDTSGVFKLLHIEMDHMHFSSPRERGQRGW